MLKRLRQVTWVHDNAYVRFIINNGMLSQYLSENNYMDFEKEDAGCNTIRSQVFEVTDHRMDERFSRTPYSGSKCDKVKIDDKEYYVVNRLRTRNKCMYAVYTELPLIIDDNNFKWKENSKYNSKEAVIIRNNFEYLCIANADGNGKIIVRYIKCENHHRNKVSIAEIDVSEVCNERFLRAIDEWTKEFKESIAA